MTEVKKTYKITQSKTAKQSKTLVQIQLAKSPQDPGLNLALAKIHLTTQNCKLYS